MPADAPRQVFRPSRPACVVGWVVTTFFVLFGLAFGPGRNRGGWPAVIIILNTGIRITTEVAANRRSYPARISAESVQISLS